MGGRCRVPPAGAVEVGGRSPPGERLCSPSSPIFPFYGSSRFGVGGGRPVVRPAIEAASWERGCACAGGGRDRGADLAEPGAVLAAVKDATRRARARWPAKWRAILDRGSARRPGRFRPGQENGPRPNRKTGGRRGRGGRPTPAGEAAISWLRGRAEPRQGWRYRATAFGGFGLDPPAAPRSRLGVRLSRRHARRPAIAFRRAASR